MKCKNEIKYMKKNLVSKVNKKQKRFLFQNKNLETLLEYLKVGIWFDFVLNFVKKNFISTMNQLYLKFKKN